tara:strand:- start:150 stop:467 length:318 start_codon:yes stop_codon:yes gene_type:complete
LARVFVVINLLTFGEAQIIGVIVINLIASALLLGAIGYFAFTGKMLRCSAGKESRAIRYDLIFDTYLTQMAVSALISKSNGWGPLLLQIERTLSNYKRSKNLYLL